MSRLRDALQRIEQARRKAAAALAGQPAAARPLRSRHLWKLSQVARAAHRDQEALRPSI